jgi:hypothetical protein
MMGINLFLSPLYIMNDIINIEGLRVSLELFLRDAASFMPTLVLALVVFVVGYIVAIALAGIVTEALKRLTFNKVFEKTVGKETIEKAELKVGPSEFIGSIVKWVLVIVVLSIIAEMLGITQFVIFLYRILAFLGQLILAILIFIIAIFLGEYLSKIVRVWMEGMKIGHGATVAIVTKVIIWMFAMFAILIELGIAQELVIIMFQGMVAFLVIAGSLAFGLGGKDVAAGILTDLQKKLKK